MAYSSTVPPGSPPADPMDPSSSSYWAFFSVQEQPGGGERSSHSWSGTFERVGHYSDDLAPSGELVGGGGGGDIEEVEAVAACGGSGEHSGEAAPRPPQALGCVVEEKEEGGGGAAHRTGFVSQLSTIEEIRESFNAENNV